MTAKQAIDKIMQLFAEEQPQAPVTNPAKEYELADGSKVLIDTLEVGGKVAVADGSPAPAGDHALADGTVISVDEQGMITQVKSPEVEQPAVPEVEVAAEVQEPSETDKLKAENEQLKKEIEELKKNKVSAQSFSEFQSKTKQAIEGLAGAIEKLIEVPSSDPIQQPQSFTAHIAENKNAKLKELLSAVDQINSKNN